jgi:hypothetical protein
MKITIGTDELADVLIQLWEEFNHERNDSSYQKYEGTFSEFMEWIKNR